MVHFIVFAIAFAVLRNLFTRVYNKAKANDKPIDFKGRFRRIFNKEDLREKTVTEEVACDLKEKMVPDSEQVNDASGCMNMMNDMLDNKKDE